MKIVFFNNQGAYIKSNIDYANVHMSGTANMLQYLDDNFPCIKGWDYVSEDKARTWIANHYGEHPKDIL